MRVEFLHRHPGCGGASLVANAIGNNQQIAQGDTDMEDGVLVLFAQDAAIAFLGKKYDWLPRDGYLVHA
jgi:hypothetical protein